MHASRTRQKIEAALDDGKGDFDVDARQEIYVQQVLNQAFLVNQQALRHFMSSKLSSGKKYPRDIPIESAKDFLAVAHAIGMTDGLSSEFEFHIDYMRIRVKKTAMVLIKKDHFTFELVQKQS